MCGSRDKFAGLPTPEKITAAVPTTGATFPADPNVNDPAKEGDPMAVAFDGPTVIEVNSADDVEAFLAEMLGVAHPADYPPITRAEMGMRENDVPPGAETDIGQRSDPETEAAFRAEMHKMVDAALDAGMPVTVISVFQRGPHARWGFSGSLDSDTLLRYLSERKMREIFAAVEAETLEVAGNA